MNLRSHTVDNYQRLRYCRALAQTYHPDKQQDEERKAAAAASFMRIQEAYEASGCGIRAPRAWATTMMCSACSQHSVDVPHGHASGKSSACCCGTGAHRPGAPTGLRHLWEGGAGGGAGGWASPTHPRRAAQAVAAVPAAAGGVACTWHCSWVKGPAPRRWHHGMRDTLLCAAICSSRAQAMKAVDSR